jgi:DNA repair exonuclease SbcCD nuclease subunit
MSKYDPDYYDKNKDKMKASNKMWYEKNKAAILTKMREKRLNRTDEEIQQTREKRKEYYEKNKDAFLNYSRNKYQEQKSKMAELEAKVKELEANNARED